jgi:uncharacterized membrane protein
MTIKKAMLILMASLYVLAGVWHFVKPNIYLKIMPPYLPAPLALVYLSGIAEVILGLGLFFPVTQSLAAWGVILLLLAILPANYYMYQKGGAAFGLSDTVLFWRLPAQFILIAWAYWFT